MSAGVGHANVRATSEAVDLGELGELVGYRLRRAQLAVFADFVRALAGLRLRPGNFGVLTVIAGNPGISQAAVCEALGIQRANFVAMAAELEGRDLVERRTSTVDRRHNAMQLTPQGERLVARAWQAVREHESRVVAALKPVDRRRLCDLLVRIEAGPGRAARSPSSKRS